MFSLRNKKIIMWIPPLICSYVIGFSLACCGLSSLLGLLHVPVQIGCIEHIMTIPWSDRKFAGGVYPHDEKSFCVIIETFGTLNLI